MDLVRKEKDNLYPLQESKKERKESDPFTKFLPSPGIIYIQRLEVEI